SSEELLASEIAAAKTDEERRSLLAANNDLLNIELIRALLAQAERLNKRLNHAFIGDLFKFAEELATGVGDNKSIARALRGMSGAYYMQGRYKEALDLGQKSLQICETSSDHIGVAASLIKIANVYFMQGDHQRAQECYERSLKIAEALGEKLQVANVLNNLG